MSGKLARIVRSKDAVLPRAAEACDYMAKLPEWRALYQACNMRRGSYSTARMPRR